MTDLIKRANDALKAKNLEEDGSPFALAELEARKRLVPEGSCGENEEVNIGDFSNDDLDDLVDKMLVKLEDGDAADFDDAAMAVIDDDKRFDDISDADADKLVGRLEDLFTKKHGKKYGVNESVGSFSKQQLADMKKLAAQYSEGGDEDGVKVDWHDEEMNEMLGDDLEQLEYNPEEVEKMIPEIIRMVKEQR